MSSVDSSQDAASSSARSTVTVIQSGRLVRVPQHERPSDPAARETRVEDRPLLGRAHDKLFKTHAGPYVRRVLRSHCPDGSGLLGRGELAAALEALHVGLGAEERERLLARALPGSGEGQGEGAKVHYLDFLRWLEVPAPLGEAAPAARGSSVPGPVRCRPGGGEPGDPAGPRFWNWHRPEQQLVPGTADAAGGEAAPAAQAVSDALLSGLVAARLGQAGGKLRRVFRAMDADHNSRIDMREFVRGLARLRIPASPAQAARLFALADADGDGTIDYTEWASRFDPAAGGVWQAAAETKRTLGSSASSAGTSSPVPGGPAPLSQRLGLSTDEVAAALASPAAAALGASLYGRGAAAPALFARADVARSGCLGLAEMTRCCQQIVPDIGERQVAALVAALEPDAGGGSSGSSGASAAQVDYRSFVGRLLEAGAGAPHAAAQVQHRLLHSAPPGGHSGQGQATGALARWGEPLTVPEALPSPHTRSLSAVGLRHHAGRDGSTGSGPHAPSGSLPPAPSAAAPTSREDIHAAAVAPLLASLAGAGAEGGLPTVSRSVDIGSLPRSGLGDGAGRGTERPERGRGQGAERQSWQSGSGASRAPSHATGRFSRFWERRYADTAHITSPHPASSAYAPSEASLLRKDCPGGAFLAFQGEDRERRAKQREQAAQRYTARSEFDSHYSAQDDTSGADAGKMAASLAIKQRYEERADMEAKLRAAEDRTASCLFGRLPAFHEHQLEGANVPQRLYW